MKKLILASMMLVYLPLAGLAQSADDLYYLPGKSSSQTSVTTEKKRQRSAADERGKLRTVVVRDADGSVRNIDDYNRRYTNRENRLSTSGDTLYIDEKRPYERGEWVNGFNGSRDDYDYAMRLVRFRSPRYAIPVSSPLYWDVVYSGLYPSWDWNVYDDGFYAYVFPSYTNRLWWDWRFSWGLGSPWGMGYYSWYSPWYNGGYYPYYGGFYAGYYGGWGGYPYYYDSPYYYGYGWGERRYVNINNRRGERTAIYAGSGMSRGTTSWDRSRSIAPDRNNRRAGSRVIRSVSDEYMDVRSRGNEVYTRSSRSNTRGSSYDRPSSTRSGSYVETGSYQRIQSRDTRTAESFRGTSSRSYSTGSSSSFSGGSTSRSTGNTGGGGARRR